MFLRGYSVAMITSCVLEKTLNCLIMIANLHDTIIEAGKKIVVVLIHQTIGAKKYGNRFVKKDINNSY